MCGCESWTIKKAKRQRIDAFALWCWRRLLRVPWTARRSNQSILKEISPGCSLEGLNLKLKLQYFGHLMRRVDSFEKTLMLRKIEGRRRRGRQRMRWLDGITWLNGHELEQAPGVGDGQGSLVCCSPWGYKESDMNDWTLSSTSRMALDRLKFYAEWQNFRYKKWIMIDMVRGSLEGELCDLMHPLPLLNLWPLSLYCPCSSMTAEWPRMV